MRRYRFYQFIGSEPRRQHYICFARYGELEGIISAHAATAIVSALANYRPLGKFYFDKLKEAARDDFDESEWEEVWSSRRGVFTPVSDTNRQQSAADRDQRAAKEPDEGPCRLLEEIRQAIRDLAAARRRSRQAAEGDETRGNSIQD